jgi:hypothetical protein
MACDLGREVIVTQRLTGGVRAASMLALILLVTWAMAAIPARAQGAGSCAHVPGTWSWFVNGNVTFHANGTLTQGNLTGRWSCQGGLVRISWSHGFVDHVRVSVDGARMSGTNQHGHQVGGQRLSGGGPRIGLFKSRWDQVGGAWTSGWVLNHTGQYCGHGAPHCQACPGLQSACGNYPNGAVITHAPYGVRGDCSTRWQLRCTSVPQ